ncbi:ABC transporter permease [Streptomyces sp. TRM49041]|uniref:ABC transporter permease n=1 Tax=Streptomyces sp. TRM49041 TaxID=2603216 RepID=UPI0011EDD79D|nr:ABC transporter permease [Streptomyces sp. TRM49041]
MSATPQRRTVAVMLLIPALVALALWAFAWPAARVAPHDLPIGVAGPEAAAAQVERGLQQREGAFDVHRYADEAAARAAIEDREVYGAVIVAQEGPKLLTASAASPAVAQLLQQAVQTQAPGGAPVPVTDVAPTPPGDPRGSALPASVLPLGLAGMAGGTVVTLLGLHGIRAVTALTGAAVLVGLVGAALTHSWLGALTGDWWTEAGVLALTALAIAATVTGLGALLGRAGLGLGALLMVLLGNPFSGAASAPELLPEPVGTIGQWLPPGAGASLLRSVAYFDGAAAGGHAVTLALWALLGLTAVLVGGRRAAAATAGRSSAGRTTPEPAPIG